MTCPATQGLHRRDRNDLKRSNANWKKAVSETLQSMELIPEKFNGKVLITFKDGGISYLEKTETLK
jgi:hypothetical protein